MNDAVDDTTRKGRQEAGSPDTQLKQFRMAASVLIGDGKARPAVHWLAEQASSVEAEAGPMARGYLLPRQ